MAGKAIVYFMVMASVLNHSQAHLLVSSVFLSVFCKEASQTMQVVKSFKNPTTVAGIHQSEPRSVRFDISSLVFKVQESLKDVCTISTVKKKEKMNR